MVMRWRNRRAVAALVLVLATALAFGSAVPSFASTAASGSASCAAKKPVKLQLLAINDFHGALEGRTLGGRPIGGAAVLASYLDTREASATALGEQTMRLGGGDLVGASPPISALLGDVPTVQALNMMDFDYSVVGNHEFDKGLANLRYLQNGPRTCGARASAEPTFTGADFSYLGANVVDAKTGKPVLKPYAIRTVKGVRVALIGVILRDTPSIVTPSGVAGLKFLDEAATVNKYVAKLQACGVHSFIVLLHQGGSGTRTGGPITGEVTPIVQAMSDDVDVVISAHSHAGYQGLIGNKLVTQAYANGTALADIDMTLDPISGDCTTKTAEIVDTYGDVAPGTTPNAALVKFVADTKALVAPIINQVVAQAATPILKAQTAAGESQAGDLIADAQKWQMGTQVCFMNSGGVRADIAAAAGPITWGALFTAQPFNNYCVKMDLTGAQIKTALEQQWQGQPYARVLQPSGISYRWSASAPLGSRVETSSIVIAGAPIGLSSTYSVTVNNFLAGGGDNFTVFKSGLNQVVGSTDIDALVAYVKQLPQPVSAPALGRIQMVP
jgi:5'-nucleotidase